MIGDSPENFGWPKGMDRETAEWLCEKISGYLERSAMPTWLIERNLSYEKSVPECWRKAAVYDWMYAAISCACNEINAEQVWRKNDRRF